jgi:hypothetical protein
MPRRRPPAYDVTTEKAIKHLFPNEAGEAVTIEPKHERADATEAESDAGPTEQYLRAAQSGSREHS